VGSRFDRAFDAALDLTKDTKPHMSLGKIMSEEKDSNGEMLDEYDFSEAEIGKFAQQYAEGTNIVVRAAQARRYLASLCY